MVAEYTLNEGAAVVMSHQSTDQLNDNRVYIDPLLLYITQSIDRLNVD